MAWSYLGIWSTLFIVIYNKKKFHFFHIIKRQVKHLSLFWENVWLESLKYEGTLVQVLETSVLTQQSTLLAQTSVSITDLQTLAYWYLNMWRTLKMLAKEFYNQITHKTKVVAFQRRNGLLDNEEDFAPGHLDYFCWCMIRKKWWSISSFFSWCLFDPLIKSVHLFKICFIINFYQ